MLTNTVSADFSFEAIQQSVEHQQDRFIGKYFDLELSSVFQPIFSFNKSQPAGFEALIRCKTHNGQNVSPKKLYQLSTYPDDIAYLDRLCRTVHVMNFMHAQPPNSWIFLNVSPQTVMRGAQLSPFIEPLLQHQKLNPANVVIEIVEDAVKDEKSLAEYVEFYRSLGCLIALDDFGSGHSNFERIWRIKPDIVKLDRNMTIQATESSRVKRLLVNLVSLIQEAGCLTLMEGIETEQEAYTALTCNVDMAQGFLFGKPDADLNTYLQDSCPLDLCERFRKSHSSKPATNPVQEYMSLFSTVLAQIWQGKEIIDSCRRAFVKNEVRRFYLLDVKGTQAFPVISNPNNIKDIDQRFSPLQGDVGTNWYRRPYFQRALQEPGKIQVSRPYLSITGVHMCITLSAAIMIGTKQYIICCDLDLEQESPLKQILMNSV